MSSVRLRTCVAGGALAVGAGLLAAKGSVLGADLPHTALLGAALGAVLGLVPGGSVPGRVGGFLSGFGAAWLGYALRAGVLPDSAGGRGLAALSVVAVVTAVAVLSAGRLPLWAGLLGAGTLLGAYESAFAANPTAFLSDSVTAITTVLVSAALGLLVATASEGLLLAAPAPGPHPEVALPAPRSSVDADVRQEVER
jgi:hypothetical protein